MDHVEKVRIAAPTDIYETTVMTDYEDAEGTYHHAEKEVMIQLRDGSLRDMKTPANPVMYQPSNQLLAADRAQQAHNGISRAFRTRAVGGEDRRSRKSPT
jgi:hypothetical protein